MGASTVGQQRAAVDLSSLNIGLPVPGLNSGREAQYARRVRELEEDVRVLKAENERQVRDPFLIISPCFVSLIGFF